MWYGWGMETTDLTPIVVSPITGDGKYADVIQAANQFADELAGTPPNALAIMARDSARYKAWQAAQAN